MKEILDSQIAAICDTPIQNTNEEDTHIYATVVEVMQGEYDEKNEVTEKKLENISFNKCPSSLQTSYSESKPINHSNMELVKANLNFPKLQKCLMKGV